MKNISTILVLLITASLLMAVCTGCSSSNNQIEGAWYLDKGSELWIIESNGTIRMLEQISRNVTTEIRNYSVDEQLFTIQGGGGDPIPYQFNYRFSGNKLILTNPKNSKVEAELTRVKPSNSKHTKAIIGTWEPFGPSSIDFHVNNIGYSSVTGLSFYSDGTYRINTEKSYGSGKYTFLFDGDMLQMEGDGSRGQFDYELFGDEFLLIKYSIYNGEMQFSYLLRQE